MLVCTVIGDVRGKYQAMIENAAPSEYGSCLSVAQDSQWLFLVFQAQLPELDTTESSRVLAFISWLREQRPFFPTLYIIRLVVVSD